MLYRVGADLLVGFHFAFILFVLGGGYLAWRWRWLVWLHVPAAVWGALIEFAGWICPLTPWEVALRRQAGEAGYAGGFIEHYLIPIVYPAGLTPAVQVVLGILVIVVNIVAYAGLVHRARQRRTATR